MPLTLRYLTNKHRELCCQVTQLNQEKGYCIEKTLIAALGWTKPQTRKHVEELIEAGLVVRCATLLPKEIRRGQTQWSMGLNPDLSHKDLDPIDYLDELKLCDAVTALETRDNYCFSHKLGKYLKWSQTKLTRTLKLLIETEFPILYTQPFRLPDQEGTIIAIRFARPLNDAELRFWLEEAVVDRPSQARTSFKVYCAQRVQQRATQIGSKVGSLNSREQQLCVQVYQLNRDNEVCSTRTLQEALGWAPSKIHEVAQALMRSSPVWLRKQQTRRQINITGPPAKVFKLPTGASTKIYKFLKRPTVTYPEYFHMQRVCRCLVDLARKKQDNSEEAMTLILRQSHHWLQQVLGTLQQAAQPLIKHDKRGWRLLTNEWPTALKDQFRVLTKDNEKFS